MSQGGLPDPLKVHTNKANGGMGLPDPLGLFNSEPPDPSSPDYLGLAREQGAQSLALARTQARLNRPTETTPFGTRSWTEGPNDTWSSNIAYSPLGQNLIDLAGKGYGRVEESFSKPFSVAGADELQNKVEKALLDRQLPQFEKMRTGRLNDTITRGHNPGTSGYETNRTALDQQENDIYSQAILNALKVRPQFLQEETAIRNQPLNEINALIQGTQLQTPQFQNWTPQGPIQGAPLLQAGQAQGNFDMGLFGIQNQQYQNEQNRGLDVAKMFFGG